MTLTRTTADDIRRMLADGDSVGTIAARTGWKPTSVQAIAERTGDQPAEPEQPAADAPPMDASRALLALVTRTIGALAKADEPHAAKEIDRAKAALERLEEALTIGQRRRQAEEEVARLKEELRAAEERLKAVKAGRTAAGATDRQIRAWAAENDIDCPRTGHVPTAVRALYDAAHAAA